MENQENIEKLFARYLSDQCSQEELLMLMEYFGAEANETLLKELIRDYIETSQHISDQNANGTAAQLDDIFQLIKKKIDDTK